MSIASSVVLWCILVLVVVLDPGCLAVRPRYLPSRGPQRQQVNVTAEPARTKVKTAVEVKEAPAARLEAGPTTCAPFIRPTTSAPQKWLRSLCLTPRGLFPHPLDCRKYLDCWDGRVLEVYCPNDLVFSDLAGGFCDYLEYVDCGSRPLLNSGPGKPTFIVPEYVKPTITHGEKWVVAEGGFIPKDSMEAGLEFETPVFVGRAYVDNHLLPCTAIRHLGCRVAWNNTEYIISNYEVLVNTAIQWIPSNSTTLVPSKAIKVGYLNFGLPLEILFMGRAYVRNELTPGYLMESRPWLVQTFNGTTYFTERYETLTLA
ncbi:hypothetical protein B566_EDAN015678 [Ephemera danica]|nr:hypothetical protein B566_EDAN015678 [Ephemera danica]